MSAVPDAGALVRAAYAVLDTDFEALANVVTTDFTLINPPDAVEPGTRIGRAEMAAALENMQGSFATVRHVPLEIEADGDRVLVKVMMIARGRASGAAIEREEGHIIELRDGKLASLRWFNTWDEAVAAFSDG